MKLDLEAMRLRLVILNLRYLHRTPICGPINKLLNLANSEMPTSRSNTKINIRELTAMQAAARLEGRQALRDGKSVIWIHGVPYADPGVIGRERGE
ncbi:hypothetical protein [Epibacterium sp. Ofav1-8]|uniref:hypothetical protein n=1 Tax=Epibacterium sp. Ofav1-8 TaxID=2917735 RepID=UPI001EF5BCF6|nr:hypothetical protein [Epibacterium sp. Ofav1-8]MCG7625939.1 hypothetical protein [Epibacterium sp. Ofav1-8]